MAESWSERDRRLRREREERRRRRRRRRAPDPVAMSRRALRRYLRSLSGPARRRLKRELRKRKYAAQKRVFGACPTCGRAGGPSHTCRMRFGEHNAARLRARMDKREQADYPNLWKGRRAA